MIFLVKEFPLTSPAAAGSTWAEPSCAICSGDLELAKTTKTTGKSSSPNWNEKLEAILPAGTHELTIKVTPGTHELTITVTRVAHEVTITVTPARLPVIFAVWYFY